MQCIDPAQQAFKTSRQLLMSLHTATALCDKGSLLLTPPAYANHPWLAACCAAAAAAPGCLQVVLGSSIDEALQWAQQNLDAPAAQLVKDALALKDQPFSSE